MGTFIKVVLLVALAFGGWKSYEHFRAGPSVADEGRALMAEGYHRQAIEWMEQARYDDPNDMSIVVDLAECYDRAGQYREAAECYREAEAYLSKNSFSVANRRHKERAEELKQRGY